MNTEPRSSSSLDDLASDVKRAESRAARRTLFVTLTIAFAAMATMSAWWRALGDAWEQVRSAQQSTQRAKAEVRDTEARVTQLQPQLAEAQARLRDAEAALGDTRAQLKAAEARLAQQPETMIYYLMFPDQDKVARTPGELNATAIINDDRKNPREARLQRSPGGDLVKLIVKLTTADVLARDSVAFVIRSDKEDMRWESSPVQFTESFMKLNVIKPIEGGN
jgi:hypothetical protein